MPISEDELDTYPYVQPHPGMSKAELRKSNKPIMEKRRRARINHSLNELKSLILEAMKKDPARHSKLEKADILEMTVKHLQTVQRQHMSSAVSADPSVLAKFQTGFSECATEVSRYITRLDGVDSGVKQRLLAHLSGCISGLNQIAPLASSALSNEDVNNNPRSLQLSRLPTGELALVLPQEPTSSQEPRNSAFTPVAPHSPLPSPSSSTASGAEPGQEVSSTVVLDEQDSLYTPLTVVTPRAPLDYSLKRPAPDLLMKCPKIPRISSETTAFRAVEPRAKPSTSTSDPTSSTTDMWRPW